MAGPDDLAIQLDALPIDISDIDMEFLTTSSLIASSASGPTRIEARQQQEQFSDHLIDLYYSEFHAVHPLLLPPRMVFSLEFSEYPHYLKSVILFIGAHYSPHCTPNDFKWDPELRRPDGIPSSVHGVQALLLLAIALHARDEQDIATEILDHAIGIAIDIGLHNKSFSEIHSNENHLVAESYRRTWWELYIVDGLFAMFHQSDYFTCYNVKSDVPLPCEEWVYTQQDVSPLFLLAAISEFVYSCIDYLIGS